MPQVVVGKSSKSGVQVPSRKTHSSAMWTPDVKGN